MRFNIGLKIVVLVSALVSVTIVLRVSNSATRVSSRCPSAACDPMGMIEMNDAFRFFASCSSPRELVTRLQFGTTELWSEDVDLPTSWRYMADLIDSDRGLLAELDGAVSIPVVETLTATAELCRQSATERVFASDWMLLRRALAWLGRTGSEVDHALLAVADELTLIGLDAAEQDFSVATWLCVDVLDRFAAADETIGYWVRRVCDHQSNRSEQHIDSEPIGSEDNELTLAV